MYLRRVDRTDGAIDLERSKSAKKRRGIREADTKLTKKGRNNSETVGEIAFNKSCFKKNNNKGGGVAPAITNNGYSDLKKRTRQKRSTSTWL